MNQGFLPICEQDMRERGWDRVDFVYVMGDAYVDHPSFGQAIISRILEAHGYRVGIISQPDWKDDESITEFGEPRLGFLVSAGNMDSMVNHFSVSKKRRHKDAYTPGGVMGKRPDYAAVVYGNLIRRTYKHTPIILGGIEASLRRLAHYDYWSDKMKRSVLLDSGADMISYGMGEHSIVEIAEALDSGIPISELTYLDGTVVKVRSLASIYDAVLLPSYEELAESPVAYAKSFYTQYQNTDPFVGKRLVEAYGDHLYVVQNPPSEPLTQTEMDAVYALPYMRTYHPSYEELGGVPAIAEIKFSLISNRGCFGGCNFCALTFHQGRILQTRSHASLLEEAVKLTEEPDFKGYIHDVGGPTANFRLPSCDKQLKSGVCKEKQCLFPRPCRNLRADHRDYVELLGKLRKVPKVKKVFIRSGIRFDYLLADQDTAFLRDLCKYHVSGQLKVAPEHVADEVLRLMGKPANKVYEEFTRKFKEMNRQLHKEQYLVPYLMSSHPGSDMAAAVKLAEYCRDLGYMPEQVQDFYPTPSTLSTCMYYTGLDPRTLEKVYVPKNPHEKALQRALIQYRRPENYELALEALRRAGRMDLVGFGGKCLIPPRKMGADRGNHQNHIKKKGSSGPGTKNTRKQDPKNTGKQNPKNTRKRSTKDTINPNGKNRAKAGTKHKPGTKKIMRNIHKKKV